MTPSQWRTVPEGSRVTLIDHEGHTLGVFYVTKIEGKEVQIVPEPGIGLIVTSTDD